MKRTVYTCDVCGVEFDYGELDDWTIRRLVPDRGGKKAKETILHLHVCEKCSGILAEALNKVFLRTESP